MKNSKNIYEAGGGVNGALSCNLAFPNKKGYFGI